MEDTAAPDSKFFRAICLASNPNAQEIDEACPTLSALAARGWSVDVRGHQRLGEVVITIRRRVDGK